MFTFASMSSQFAQVNVIDESTGVQCSAAASYQATSMLVTISPSCVPNGRSLSVGAIAGIVVGCLVGGTVVGVGVVMVRRICSALFLVLLTSF